MLHIKFGFVGQAVLEKKIFEIVDGWTPDHGHPCEPNDSGELKMEVLIHA